MGREIAGFEKREGQEDQGDKSREKGEDEHESIGDDPLLLLGVFGGRHGQHGQREGVRPPCNVETPHGSPEQRWPRNLHAVKFNACYHETKFPLKLTKEMMIALERWQKDGILTVNLIF